MSIRKTLVTCHALILAFVLLVFAVGLYFSLSYHLFTEVDSSLKSWAAHIIESIEADIPLLENRLRLNSDHLFSRLSLMDSFALLFDHNYNLVNDSTILSKQSLTKLQQVLMTSDPLRDTYATVNLDTQAFRIFLTPVPDEKEQATHILITGRALMHVEETLRELAVTVAGAWLMAVIICAFISWLFVGRTLHPVKIMTQDSLKIAVSGKLGKRLNEVGENDEFGELSKALNSMLGSLEASYMTMRKFLAAASHELRTPLTSIRSNLEFMLRTTKEDGSEQLAALEDTLAGINRMAGLVNDLLMLARAEAPASFTFEPINLAKLVCEVAASYAIRSAELKHEVIADTNGIVLVNGDREKLRQAIVILLDNAIKYSPAESPVRLQLATTGNMVQFKVIDNGLGIPEAEIDSIGKYFYRATNVRASYPGSGLGLAIVKSILENHNGNLKFCKAQPRGLEVTLSLPLLS